jgi:hypothetical protein
MISASSVVTSFLGWIHPNNPYLGLMKQHYQRIQKISLTNFPSIFLATILAGLGRNN